MSKIKEVVYSNDTYTLHDEELEAEKQRVVIANPFKHGNADRLVKNAYANDLAIGGNTRRFDDFHSELVKMRESKGIDVQIIPKETRLISIDDRMDDMRTLFRNVLRRDRIYTLKQSCYADKDLIAYSNFIDMAKVICPKAETYATCRYEITMPFVEMRKGFWYITGMDMRCAISLVDKSVIEYELLKTFPLLRSIRHTMNNVFIAGGAITNVITRMSTAYITGKSDVDIFIYGLSEIEANTKICAIINSFNEAIAAKKEKARRKHDRPDGYYVVKTVKNKYTLSIRFRRRWYQIIFRLYKTRSEILHGFDVGASAVGWDGDEIYFTTLGCFSHLTNRNIHDPQRASPTYKERLIKYMERGFTITMPYISHKLDPVHAVSESCYYPEKHLKSTHVKVNNRKYYRVKYCFEKTPEAGSEPSVSCGYSSIMNKGIHRIAMINAMLDVDYYWSYYDGDTIPMIHQFDKMIIPIPSFDVFLSAAQSGNVYNIYKFFSEEDSIRIIKAMHGREMHVIKSIALNRHAVVESQLYEFEDSRRNTNIEWMTENPGAQGRVSGSVKPRPTDPKDYWGIHYKPFPVMLSWSCVRLLWIANRDPDNVWAVINKNIIQYIINIWLFSETTDIWWDTQRGIDTIRGLMREIVRR